MDLLIKLSETDKKVIIILLLLFIIIFALIGYVSYVVQRIMKAQGSKADQMLANVVKANYFDKENKLIRYGRKCNARQFYKSAKIPFIVLLAACIGYVLFCLFTNKWGYNPFNNEDGFGSLIIKFDWPRGEFFGIKNFVIGWPTVSVRPRFEVTAIFSYIFVPILFAAGFWFLICTQAYIARSYRITKIARGIFRKKLVPDEAPTPITNQQ